MTRSIEAAPGQTTASDMLARVGVAVLAATDGTPLAGIVRRLDAFRVRRPLVFWSVAATLVAGIAVAIAGGAAVATGNGGGSGSRSALDALTPQAATGATMPGAAGPTSALLGGSVDPVDLIVKGGLVIVLLFVTLKVLRRVQVGAVPADAKIQVIESRTLAAKTQLHLVAVGGRQILIGATPGRLVTLAELPADDTFESAMVDAAGAMR